MADDYSVDGIDESRELHLLTSVQAYFEICSVGGTPDSLLVAAWKEFYTFYDQLMARFARRCGVSDEDIEDCVQAVWQRVIENLPQFEFRGNCRGLRDWFFTLVKNQAIDHLRQESRHPTVSLTDVIEAGGEPCSPQSSSAADLEQCWDCELVWRVLDKLRERESETNYRVLYLRWIDELGVQEIAAILKLTPRQVSYRLCRVQQRFRILFNVYAGHQFDEVTHRQAAKATAEILQPVRSKHASGA